MRRASDQGHETPASHCQRPTPQTIQYPFLERPSQILRELRQEEPVVEVALWNGRRAWLVTRHADALQALTDRRLSTDATNPNFPKVNPSQAIPNYRASLARMDEARHGVLRNLLTSKFTVRATQSWRQVAEQIAAEQLAALLRDGPPADLIGTFARPMPLRVMCRMLGVPEGDEDTLGRYGYQVMSRAFEPARQAAEDLHDFIDQLVRRSETSPGDDLIGQLVREQVAPGAITHQELVDFAFVLLVAGHVTTGSTIGLSVFSLLEEPDRYRALRQDPTLAGAIVAEHLRLQTIVGDGLSRLATGDLVLGGVTVRAGDAVIISLISSNLDEAVFADPDVLQPGRAGAHRHVAFGWGPHRCLGQHLATMELEVALTALASTIPTLRLAVPVERIRSGQREKHIKSLPELSVTW